jgi:hypothetical protein
MPVTLAYTGVNTFYFDLKGNFTVLKVVGIKEEGSLIIGEAALNFSIDMIDAEIKVCMLFIDLPRAILSVQRAYY